MSNPFDFFDKIYCINLPDHVERLAQANQEFEKVGIADRVEVVYCTPPHRSCAMVGHKYPRGELGCWLSQGKALMHALASGAENVLILEDDVVFVDDTLSLLQNSIDSLPVDWDIFFLGGVPRQKVTEKHRSVVRTGKFLTTIGYAVPRSSLLRLCDQWLDVTEKRVPLSDGVTSLFSQKNNGYAAYPYLCYQRPGFSTIRGATRNYKAKLDIHWDRCLPNES